MSFFEEDDCVLSEAITNEDLTVDEQNGLIALPGQVQFADLADPAEIMGSSRYGVTFRMPKDADTGRSTEDGTNITFGSLLFAVGQRVMENGWSEDDERIDVVWDALDKGVNRKMAPFGCQDGDLSKYAAKGDAGNWVIKASRNETKGRPALYARDGSAIFAPNTEGVDEDGDTYVINGELVGDANEVADFPDLAMVLCRLWVMDEYDRLNIEVIGVATKEKGKKTGGKARAIAAQNNALAAIASGEALTMPSNLAIPEVAGDDEDEAAEEAAVSRKAPKKGAKKSAAKKAAGKKAPKKAAAKKGAAKKAAKKKGKSVFKK